MATALLTPGGRPINRRQVIQNGLSTRQRYHPTAEAIQVTGASHELLC